MVKLAIAIQLLENSTKENERLAKRGLKLGDERERGYLQCYISNYEAIQKNDLAFATVMEGVALQLDGIKELDLCLELIVSEAFDVTDWLLFGMPIAHVFCFTQISRHRCFDVTIDRDKAIPGYLDMEQKTCDAASIKSAIDSYF